MDMRPGAADYLTSQMGCEDQLDARERELADAAARGDAVAYYQAANDHGESPGRWSGRAAGLLGLTDGETASTESVKTVLGELKNPSTGEQLGSAPRNYQTREQRFAKALDGAGENVTAEQRRELWNQVTDRSRSATGFYDLTFSAQKSVSVYWSSLQADGQQHLADAVARAHRDATAAAMDFLEREATWTRVGEHRAVPGGRTSGRFEHVDRLLSVEFDHSTSRAEDPHLHTHVAVANRVPCEDGQWRAIHGAGWNTTKASVAAVYERTLAEQVEAHTPARFVAREDGLGREIAGISSEALEASSQRTREVQQAQSQAVAEFRESYGRAPSEHERRQIHRQAGLESRSAKSGRDPAEQLSQWRERVDTHTVAREVAAAGRDIDAFGRPDADAFPDPLDRDAVARAAVHRVQSRAPTFNGGELAAEVERQIEMAPPGVEDVTAYAREIAEEATTNGRHGVLSISRPEPVTVPDWWRDDTGRPVWTDPTVGRYTTRDQLRTEQDLVVTARQHTHRGLQAAELRDAEQQLLQRGLNDGQRQAVLGVLASPRAANALVSGAGTGKSYAVGQLAEQWEQRTGGRVLGLATSQRATDVLQEDGLDAINTTRFLTAYEPDAETGKPQARLGHRDMLVVDESNMSSTQELARIQRIAQQSGAKLLYTGDPQQLQAVGAGGALGLIAEENGAFELTEVRRFQQQWERDASLRLRQGDVDVLAQYEQHGRLRGGTAEEMREQAIRGYLADSINGRESLVITETNGEAAEVSAIAQRERERLGQLGETLPLQLGDGNTVHTGDLIQMRRNDRTVPVDGELSMVTNRERYIVAGGDEQQLHVRRIDDAGQAWLPAEYASQHTTLGYAATEHAAEGMTVDTGHSLHTGYVGLTRGREANTAYLTTYTAGDEHGPAVQQTPREVFAAAMSRDATEQTAVQQYRAELAAAEHTAQTVAVWDYVNRELAGDRHGDAIVATLGRDAADRIAMEDGRPQLYESLRQAELHGQNVPQLLQQVVHERPLDRVDDLAGVLRWRVDQHIAPKAEPASWSDRTVHVPGPLGEFQREVAGLIDSRERELARQAADQQPEWAVQALGPVPEASHEQRADWERRAGQIAGYRELRQIPEDRLTLGARPLDVLDQIAYDQAAEASGLEPTALDYSTADEATLQAWLQRADRAAAWAPEYVHDQLGQAREVTARREQELTLLQQRSGLADGDEAEQLHAEIERSTELLGRLREREQVLDQLHTTRQEWLQSTAATRERGEDARQELARRAPTTQDESVASEQTELVSTGELMPDLDRDRLVEVQTVADRNAEVAAAQQHEQQLATEREPERQEEPAVRPAAQDHEQQEELFSASEATSGNARAAADAEALQVETGELESSDRLVSSGEQTSVRDAQTKARYATEMLQRHGQQTREDEQVEDQQAQQARDRTQQVQQVAETTVEVEQPQLSME